MSIIYLITSPSNKVYIGQTIDTIDNRWRDHLYDCLDPNKDHCKALNNAIRKYGKDNFEREILLYCNDQDLDYYEEKFISLYDSANPKYGYNIKLGGSSGKHSEATKRKISISLKGRIVKESTRKKLSLTKKSDKNLPMYIVPFKYNNKVAGYRICNHPKGPERKFSDSNLSMEEKLKKAKEYLDFLNSLEEPIKVKKRELPKHVQKCKHGYCVKVPGKKTKYFLNQKFTQEERLSQALKYKNQITKIL